MKFVLDFVRTTHGGKRPRPGEILLHGRSPIALLLRDSPLIWDIDPTSFTMSPKET
ncbi:MAG: hypothetical protein M0T78_12300 [Actinomycetota bacterium]|nr:hypothetical protein [Actinomycetota bacterium]